MSTESDEIKKWPHSIRGINELLDSEKRAIYLTIIPDIVFHTLKVDRNNETLVQVVGPRDTRAVELRLYHREGARDPSFYLHIADTLNYQIAILLLVINDPESERYNVDVDERGLPTRFGTLRRNIPEEMRALEAGLAPGQVRQGLRISRQTLPQFERFIARTGHDSVIIDPLTYHNAIIYERYGFSYFQGRQRMEWINKVLRPRGELFDEFDGSSPFRMPSLWKHIRGRSWAIHDGILGEPFGDIRMYKQIGHHAGIDTFPGGVW